MGNELNDDDLLRLHGLVDGELAPAERAEIAARLAVDRDLARAYATLAQLKATLGDVAPADAPAFTLPAARRTNSWRLGLATAAACIVAAIGIGLWVENKLPSDGSPITASAEGPTAIIHASLPAGTTIPRLDTAGLTLIGLAIDPGKVPLFTASYRGPHGCRLDLRAWRSGAAAPALSGTSRHQWTTGGLVYELVAHGMPPWRFAIIAGAAEQQTRQGSDPDRIDRRLRQAAIGAPPCLG
jgi:anti-sigma factor RsiW